jgi:Flp pilus assembly protein CpaB
VAKRSTLLVAIGVLVFLLGAGVVVLSLHKHAASGQDQAASGAASHTAVVVASTNLAKGTTGETLIASRKVSLQAVPAKEYSSADLTSLSALDQQTLNRPIAAGQAIQPADLSVEAGVLAPPPGQESMVLTLTNAASGLAGYLQPGSKVNVYGEVTKLPTGATASRFSLPCVTLVEPNVEVLDVSDAVPPYVSNPSAAGRTAPSTVTALVAVTPTEAMKLVYYTTNEELYLAEAATSKVSVTGACSSLKSSTDLTPAS